MQRKVLIVAAIGLGLPGPLSADNLFLPEKTSSLVSDHRATRVGDTLTVVVVQSAEASTTVRNGTRKSNSITGRLSAGSVDESADASLGSGFEGQGQASRSERFVTQLTAKVYLVLPNGDLEIIGGQRLNINGETTTVEVRGIVRSVDIDGENRVPSNRIADAKINYNGKGFVSRGAKSGLLQQLFTLFGLL